MEVNGERFKIKVSDDDPDIPVIKKDNNPFAALEEQKCKQSSAMLFLKNFQRIKEEVKRGNVSKAAKTINSHGVVSSSKLVKEVLEKMHPDHSKSQEPIKVKQNDKYIQLDFDTCVKDVLSQVKKDDKAMYVYGWKANYLEPVCGDKMVITTIARLMQLFARADLPRAAGLILSAGKLVALNKIAEKENIELVNAGEDPKVRPINIPQQLLSRSLSKSVASDTGKKAAKKLEPIQFSGRKNGATKKWLQYSTQSILFYYG